MHPSDLPRWRALGAPTISPDGRTAVVAIRRIDADADDYTSQLWLVPTDGSEPARALTHGWRDSAPRYSPDGRWLAFVRASRAEDGTVGKPQLHVLPTGGGEPHRLTDHPLGAGAPVWSPDSRRLAYTARIPEPGRYGTAEGVGPHAEPPRRITRLTYRMDDLGFLTDRPSQLHVVDVEPADAGGVPAEAGTAPAEPVALTDDAEEHGDPSWSPDGAWIAFVTSRHAERELDLVSDVWVCRPDGSEARQVTRGGLSVGQPVFAPDGSAICFVGQQAGPDGRQVVARNAGLWSVPADGSAAPRRLTDEERYCLGRGAKIEATAEGVLFPAEHRGAVDLLRIPYDGGDPTVLLSGRREVLAAAAAAGTVLASVAGTADAGELVAVDADGAERTLTHFGAALDGVEVRPLVELDATAPDGYPVHGWLVTPAGAGPHPVLLMIHGGPFTQYGWALFDEAQVYAGAGYAVVMGNPRGSSGYGQAHGRAVMGDVGAVSAADLLALLDRALAAEPSLDRGRVGVLGGSHGGFMATWLAAHHGDRFGAAVSERAVNAIDSFTGSSDIGWWFADDLYGPDPEGQRRQSPLTHADKIDIPVLIIHSEHDWRCPVEQAQRLFVALKRRGVPTEMLLFPGEGHEMSRSGRPSHRTARFEAILEWFGRHL